MNDMISLARSCYRLMEAGKTCTRRSPQRLQGQPKLVRLSLDYRRVYSACRHRLISVPCRYHNSLLVSPTAELCTSQLECPTVKALSVATAGNIRTFCGRVDEDSFDRVQQEVDKLGIRVGTQGNRVLNNSVGFAMIRWMLPVGRDGIS